MTTELEKWKREATEFLKDRSYEPVRNRDMLAQALAHIETLQSGTAVIQKQLALCYNSRHEADLRIADLEKRAVVWVDVKERLPEKDNCYLVHGENATTCEEIYFNAQARIWGDHTTGVTHWAHKPAPYEASK